MVLLLGISAPAWSAPSGKITFLRGEVHTVNKSKKKPARIGDAVYSTTRIITGKDGFASILYQNAQHSISANANVTVKSLDQNGKKVVHSSAIRKSDYLTQKKYLTTVAGTRASIEGQTGTMTAEMNGTGNNPQPTNDPNKEKIQRLDKAAGLMEQKKYKGVIQFLKKPENADEMYILAMAYLHLGKNPAALSWLAKARTWTMGELTMHIDLAAAEIYFSQGNYPASIAELQKTENGSGIEKKDILPQIWYLLAQNYDFTGEPEKAEFYRQRAVKFHPDFIPPGQ